MVSTPVSWEEVAGEPEALVFAPSEVLARLARVGDLLASLAGPGS
jgi:DNA primase